MEMTAKAVKEIGELEAKLAKGRKEIERLQTLADTARDNITWKAYRKEADKLWTASYRYEDTIKLIKQSKISSSERNSLKREFKDGGSGFYTIESDRGLGYRTKTVIGKSKALGQYAKVTLTHYSGFMRNVKGCASMADKTDLDDFQILTEEEYNAILAKNERVVTTSFIGGETKTMPIR